MKDTWVLRQSKPSGYYAHGRPELYGFLSQRLHRVFPRILNVGCADGADAATLRGLGAIRIVGIEPVASAARQAALAYDAVYHSTFETWAAEAGAEFDLIVFADVLEHLEDPRTALHKAGELLAGHGVILISIPNVRHMSVLFQLFVLGDWRYVHEGILDETHRRFYTLKSFIRVLNETHLEIVAMRYFGLGRWRSIDRVIPALAGIMRSQMFFIVQPTTARYNFAP